MVVIDMRLVSVKAKKLFFNILWYWDDEKHLCWGWPLKCSAKRYVYGWRCAHCGPVHARCMEPLYYGQSLLPWTDTAGSAVTWIPLDARPDRWGAIAGQKRVKLELCVKTKLVKHEWHKMRSNLTLTFRQKKGLGCRPVFSPQATFERIFF